MKSDIDLISIIVPVYNVEEYIEQCIKSILCQTYQKVEILLIDDGSTDKSGVICDNYAKDFSKIKVIHKENGGLSSARNAGIDVAKGKYLVFIDSDDYISDKMIETLYEKIIVEDAELAICGVQKVTEDGCNIKTVEIETNIVNRSFLFEKSIEDEGWVYVTAWNRMYKSKVFENLRFINGKNNEDMFLAPYLYEYCEKICLISDKLYFYRQRQGSIMNSRLSANSLNRVESYYAMFMYLQKHANMLASRAAKKTCDLYLKIRWKIRGTNEIEKNYIREVNKQFEETYFFVYGVGMISKIACKFSYIYSILYTFLFYVRLIKRKVGEKIGWND